MKYKVTLLVIASQLSLAPVAQAASLDHPSFAPPTRTGAFAGARIRLPLGGREVKRKVRMGFAFTSLQVTHRNTGMRSYRYAEGVEFGFTGSEAQPRLRIGGHALGPTGLNAAEDEQSEKKGGRSTLGTVGIIAGGLLLVGGIGVLVLNDALDDASE